MRHAHISFEEFNENFIKNPDGFMPVYAAVKEDDYGEANEKAIQIDMICEWRLTDGKVKFLEVPYKDKEEFDAIIGYLKTTAKLLNDKILKRIGDVEDEYIQQKHRLALQENIST